jgi:hypothetical protein
MKTEVSINAAAVAALAGLTTAEDIDISSIVVEWAQNSPPQRPVDKQPVQGDNYPILTQDDGISETTFNVTVLYTKGADALGTDTIDFYQDILRPMFHNSSPLALPHIFSATGEVGDFEYTTHATETFITACPDPVGGATSEKIKLTYTIETSTVTDAVIT